MATVNLLQTRINDVESGFTTVNVPSGGGGAGANTDIFLQGAQSLGRRQTTTGTAAGFALIDDADSDVSADNAHVGFWFWVTHYGIIDELVLLLLTGTGSTVFDAHNFPFATEFPQTGGWVRGWIDVSRTPDAVGAGGGLDEAALRGYGIQVSFTGAPGGNAANLIIDAGDFVVGASLSLTGTAGVWQDFVTADENPTNQYGVMRRIGGVINCFARVQLGTASSLVFSDSGFVIVFPQQALVSDTFMGINIDLQHASTVIEWSNAVVRSAGTKRGDLVVSGTSGDFIVTNTTFANLRSLLLTAGAVLTGCLISQSGTITPAGASLLDCSIIETTASAAVLWNTADDTSGRLDGTSFAAAAGTGHGLQLGINTPDEITLAGVIFTGYDGTPGSNPTEDSGDTRAAIWNTSGKEITINITEGGTTPSVRNQFAGSTTIVVSGQVTLTLTGLVAGSEVRIYQAGTETEVAGIESSGTSFGYTYSFSSQSVDIVVLHLDRLYLRIEGFALASTDASLPIAQQIDRQYNNP